MTERRDEQESASSDDPEPQPEPPETDTPFDDPEVERLEKELDEQDTG